MAVSWSFKHDSYSTGTLELSRLADDDTGWFKTQDGGGPPE